MLGSWCNCALFPLAGVWSAVIRVYLQSPVHIAFTQSPNWGLPGRCHDMWIALEIKKFELCLFYCMSHCRYCLSSYSSTVIKVAWHGQLKGNGLKFQRDQPIPQDRANWRDMGKLTDHIVFKFKRQNWTGTELGLCSLKPQPPVAQFFPFQKSPTIFPKCISSWDQCWCSTAWAHG